MIDALKSKYQTEVFGVDFHVAIARFEHSKSGRLFMAKANDIRKSTEMVGTPKNVFTYRPNGNVVRWIFAKSKFDHNLSQTAYVFHPTYDSMKQYPLVIGYRLVIIKDM